MSLDPFLAKSQECAAVDEDGTQDRSTNRITIVAHCGLWLVGGVLAIAAAIVLIWVAPTLLSWMTVGGTRVWPWATGWGVGVFAVAWAWCVAHKAHLCSDRELCRWALMIAAGIVLLVVSPTGAALAYAGWVSNDFVWGFPAFLAGLLTFCGFVVVAGLALAREN